MAKRTDALLNTATPQRAAKEIIVLLRTRPRFENPETVRSLAGVTDAQLKNISARIGPETAERTKRERDAVLHELDMLLEKRGQNHVR